MTESEIMTSSSQQSWQVTADWHRLITVTQLVQLSLHISAKQLCL